MKPLDTNEVVVVVALGEDGAGAQLLSRVMRKSWGSSASRKGSPFTPRSRRSRSRRGEASWGERAGGGRP